MTTGGVPPLPGMVGRHPSMQAVYRLVRKVAPTDLPIVIVGETGTGKELVARAVHDLSGYRDGPFVDVNCAAVPESLAEAELFGWERGAFTGAVRQQAGLLEAAAGGTLFLDEACSLSHAIQAKLLRAIEQRGFRRVGGRTRRGAAFRVVAAVSKPIDALRASGAVRDDFAYRIVGASVVLPPLRSRGRDVLSLAEHFLTNAASNGRPPQRIGVEAARWLQRHPWDGNVRELKALMERLHALVDAPVLLPEHILPELQSRAQGVDDRLWLSTQLELRSWDVKRTAKDLGIGRTKLYTLIRHHGLERPSDAPA